MITQYVYNDGGGDDNDDDFHMYVWNSKEVVLVSGPGLCVFDYVGEMVTINFT